MKIKEIASSNNRYLKFTDFENFFNMYLDKNDNIFFNLNNTVYFNVEKKSLPEYQLTFDGYWPLISYKLYGTTRLAWALMKVNNIDARNVFQKKYAGEKIHYIPKDDLQQIILNIVEGV